MGAIVTGFDQLPDEDRAAYARIYRALSRRGWPVPAIDSTDITRPQLLAHLRSVAGQIVRDELDNDPEGRGYGAQDNATAAHTCNEPYQPDRIGTRVQGAHTQGYVTLAGSTDAGILAEKRIAGGDPDFVTLLTNGEGVQKRGLFIRFRPNTPRAALRGQIAKIQAVTASNGIAMGVQAPFAIPAGEVFDVGYLNPPIFRARVAMILDRLPYGPNVLTADDITGARS